MFEKPVWAEPIVLERALAADHRGQLLVLNVDQVNRVLGEVAALGHDHGHGLPEIRGLVAGERIHRRARSIWLREVGERDHRVAV